MVKPDGRAVSKRLSIYGVYLDGQRVLVIRPEWSTLWELPGGGLEPGETFIECLAREFNEETGLVITDVNKAPLGRLKQPFYMNDTDEYFEAELLFFKVTAVRTGDGIDRSESGEVAELSFEQMIDLDETNCRAGHLKMIRTAAN